MSKPPAIPVHDVPSKFGIRRACIWFHKPTGYKIGEVWTCPTCGDQWQKESEGGWHWPVIEDQIPKEGRRIEVKEIARGRLSARGPMPMPEAKGGEEGMSRDPKAD